MLDGVEHREEEPVGFTKHGTGEVLRDEKQRKQAAKEQVWDEQDESALKDENEQADQ